MIRFATRKIVNLVDRRVLTQSIKEYSTQNDGEDDALNRASGKRKVVLTKGVKLYPGYQQSQEELLAQATYLKASVPIKDAKKAIEDFYGLNELEYDEKNEEEVDDDEKEDEVSRIMRNTKRDTQTNAVFDVQSIVNILKSQNIQDLVCIRIPNELNYANYMIIGTCSSSKHINSSSICFNQIYKRSKEDSDSFIKKSCTQTWCAIDAGNVVIHLFVSETRELYDLETLWTVGSKYDDRLNQFLNEARTISHNLTFTE